METGSLVVGPCIFRSHGHDDSSPASSRRSSTTCSSHQRSPNLQASRACFEFEVQLHKEEGVSLGMTPSFTTDEFVIKTLRKDGLVAEWNQNNPNQSICVGDVLIEVNGIKGGRAMLAKKCHLPGPQKWVLCRVGASADEGDEPILMKSRTEEAARTIGDVDGYTSVAEKISIIEQNQGLALGSRGRILATGRIGQVVRRDMSDERMTYKLVFSDGELPHSDWFAIQDVLLMDVAGRVVGKWKETMLKTGGTS